MRNTLAHNQSHFGKTVLITASEHPNDINVLGLLKARKLGKNIIFHRHNNIYEEEIT